MTRREMTPADEQKAWRTYAAAALSAHRIEDLDLDDRSRTLLVYQCSEIADRMLMEEQAWRDQRDWPD